ncbi:DUF3747 domain-containing protein [Stanieria cyanosphaera]|nr:DUF3747 domain-containing protein [Stanieria cyanosphaera]
MMTFIQRTKLLALALGAIALPLFTSTSKAVAFEEQAVNSGQFLAVAVPFGYKEYRLEIIEQIPGKQPCWQESGSGPVTVNLLLNNFDYTGSCKRITNTNGYTLRLNGQDDAVSYVNKIVERNGELQLIAFHKDPKLPDLTIGRTKGLTANAMRVFLEPGWQITKRVHQGQVVDHVYLSGNSTTANNPVPFNFSNSNLSITSPTPNNPSASSFPTNPQAANTTVNPTPVLSGSTIMDGVSQVYQGVVSPILGSIVGGVTGGTPQATSQAACQPGSAVWTDSGTAQQVAVLADGTVQLGNQQVNIKPILTNNGINPEQFLSGPNSAQLDFDGDGAVEEFKIQQPPQACTSTGY